MSSSPHESNDAFPELLRPGWRELYEHAPVGLCEVNGWGVIVAINQTLLSWLGYRPHEVSGRLTFDRLLATGGSERLQNLQERCAREGRLAGIELEFCSKDGNRQLVGQMNATALFDSQGHFTGWRGSVQASTLPDAPTQRYLQTHTLEVIERLAGHAARRFEAILRVVLGSTEQGLAGLNEFHPIYSRLLSVKEAALQAVELARELEAFGGRQELQQRLINLNEFLSNLAARFPVLRSHQIGLTLLLKAERPMVNVDCARLEQALLHVLTNACEAMPQGGTLLVQTENTTLEPRLCEPYTMVASSEYVCLSVTDTGVGMDQATMGHVFEPFFTTKENGSGLGLSIVWGIVKQHAGHVDVSSRPGLGTTLRIYLPVQAWEASEQDLPGPGRCSATAGRQ